MTVAGPSHHDMASISLKPQEAPIPLWQGFLQWGSHTAPPNGPQMRTFTDKTKIQQMGQGKVKC